MNSHTTGQLPPWGFNGCASVLCSKASRVLSCMWRSPVQWLITLQRGVMTSRVQSVETQSTQGAVRPTLGGTYNTHTEIHPIQSQWHWFYLRWHFLQRCWVPRDVGSQSGLFSLLCILEWSLQSNLESLGVRAWSLELQSVRGLRLRPFPGNIFSHNSELHVNRYSCTQVSIHWPPWSF